MADNKKVDCLEEALVYGRWEDYGYESHIPQWRKILKRIFGLYKYGLLLDRDCVACKSYYITGDLFITKNVKVTVVCGEEVILKVGGRFVVYGAFFLPQNNGTNSQSTNCAGA